MTIGLKVKLLLDTDNDGDTEEEEEAGTVPWNPNGAVTCCWYGVGVY